MSIDEKTLLEERKVLEEDFNTTKDRIAQVEKDLNNMKNNINAVYGAIQQIDKLIVLAKGGKEEKKPMPPEKEKALNIATS
jgi:septal ring factor EnvC (AmiA/AmiB activator)